MVMTDNCRRHIHVTVSHAASIMTPRQCHKHVMSHHVMSRHTTSCHIRSCRITSRHIMSRHRLRKPPSYEQTDRQTHRQTHRQTDTQTDRRAYAYLGRDGVDAVGKIHQTGVDHLRLFQTLSRGLLCSQHSHAMCVYIYFFVYICIFYLYICTYFIYIYNINTAPVTYPIAQSPRGPPDSAEMREFRG